MMKLCDKITIVVPCKNEENYIHHLLDALRNQDIGDTRVIIADCSTDATRQVIKDNSIGLNVEIIDGGPVSIAKNNGARLVTTPYILFIDADVRFFKDTVIQDSVNKMELKKLHLVGLNIKCYDKDIRAKIGFTAFNLINHTLKFFSPFAVGAFMLTRKDKFEEYGGFLKPFQRLKTISYPESIVLKSLGLLNIILVKTVADSGRWAIWVWPSI